MLSVGSPQASCFKHAQSVSQSCSRPHSLEFTVVSCCLLACLSLCHLASDLTHRTVIPSPNRLFSSAINCFFEYVLCFPTVLAGIFILVLDCSIHRLCPRSSKTFNFLLDCRSPSIALTANFFFLLWHYIDREQLTMHFSKLRIFLFRWPHIMDFLHDVNTPRMRILFFPGSAMLYSLFATISQS